VSNENAAAAAAVLPIFICPTSERPSPRVKGRGACDYGGIFGERITSPNNPPINQAPTIENDIRSDHLGGAFGLFCDGHVALLAEEMDPDVLAAICTRARQEKIEPVRIESFLK
jgi:prepilin-type processing-associated H-X9-DG protein